MAGEREEEDLRFEVPEDDAAEQALEAVPEDPPPDAGPLPDEANPADVVEQRTLVPGDDEDDAR